MLCVSPGLPLLLQANLRFYVPLDLAPHHLTRLRFPDSLPYLKTYRAPRPGGRKDLKPRPPTTTTSTAVPRALPTAFLDNQPHLREGARRLPCPLGFSQKGLLETILKFPAQNTTRGSARTPQHPSSSGVSGGLSSSFQTG